MTQGMSGGFFLPAQRSVHCKGGFFTSDTRAQVSADRLFKSGPRISVAPPLEKTRGGGNQPVDHGSSMLFTPSLPKAAAASVGSSSTEHTSATEPVRTDASSVTSTADTATRSRSQGRLRTSQVVDRSNRRAPTPPSNANARQHERQRTSAPRDVHSKFEVAMQELNEIKDEFDLKQKRQNSAPVLVEAGRVRIGAPITVITDSSSPPNPTATQPQIAAVDSSRDLASPRQRLQVAEMVMRKLYKRNLETEKELSSWKAKYAALEKERLAPAAAPEANPESQPCQVCELRVQQCPSLVLAPPTAATVAHIDNQQLEYLRHLAAEQDKTITALKIRIEQLSNQITHASHSTCT